MYLTLSQNLIKTHFRKGANTFVHKKKLKTIKLEQQECWVTAKHNRLQNKKSLHYNYHTNIHHGYEASNRSSQMAEERIINVTNNW